MQLLKVVSCILSRYGAWLPLWLIMFQSKCNTSRFSSYIEIIRNPSHVVILPTTCEMLLRINIGS
jgi:hypothetical protein